MAKQDGDCARVQADVDVVEHGATHGHAKVHLVHGRDIRRQQGYLYMQSNSWLYQFHVPPKQKHA
jgi:hypothetical protein